ncbi:MAG: hypothetical protein V3U75_12785 [Methylococcaceae bacterium]
MEALSSGLNTQKFNDAMSQYIAAHYIPDNNGGMACIECGAKIQQTTCYVSVHDERFSSCTGGGEVKTIPLPYCPKCEGIPKRTSTCVHV